MLPWWTDGPRLRVCQRRFDGHRGVPPVLDVQLVGAGIRGETLEWWCLCGDTHWRSFVRCVFGDLHTSTGLWGPAIRAASGGADAQVWPRIIKCISLARMDKHTCQILRPHHRHRTPHTTHHTPATHPIATHTHIATPSPPPLH